MKGEICPTSKRFMRYNNRNKQNENENEHVIALVNYPLKKYRSYRITYKIHKIN